MRLARFQKSQNIERAIQMSYFLILEMINKSQIHTCFESIIIDIYIKFILPSTAVWIHLRAVIIVWAICHKQSRDFYRQNLSWRVLRTLPCFAWMLQVCLYVRVSVCPYVRMFLVKSQASNCVITMSCFKSRREVVVCTPQYVHTCVTPYVRIFSYLYVRVPVYPHVR